MQIGKEELKLLSFQGDMITYLENSKESIIIKTNQNKKNQTTPGTTGRLQDTRLIYKSQSLSYLPAMNKWNLKFKMQYHLH